MYNPRMPDAITVATAIVHGAEVLLMDDRSLGVVKEIRVMGLTELEQKTRN